MTKYCTTTAVRFETLNDFYGFATNLKDPKWKCEAVNVVVGVAVYHEGGGGGRSFRSFHDLLVRSGGQRGLKDSKWKCEAVNVVVGVAVYHEGDGGYICSGAWREAEKFSDLFPGFQSLNFGRFWGGL